MVNTLYASRDGMHVITGDAHGVLKVWDIRSRKYWEYCDPELMSDPTHSHNAGTCISSTTNGTTNMPISHITIGRRRTDAARRAG